MKDIHVDKSVKEFQCEQCPFATHASRSLKNHKLNCHDDTSKKLICQKCHRKFRFPYHFKEHKCVPLLDGEEQRSGQLTKGPRKIIECLECGAELRGRPGLVNHYRVTHKKLPPGYENQEQFICEQCSDIFVNEDALTKHINNKHSHPEERQCPECGKEFSGQLYLGQHYKHIHGGVLPSMEDREKFMCDQCPSVFFAKGSLVWHQNQHHLKMDTDPNPNIVPARRKPCPHCPMSFAANSSLKEHVKSKHEMNTPYKCDQCHRSYGTKCRLIVHQNSMHKRIKCDICGQEICNAFILKRHKASVHGVTPMNVVNCEHCSLFFEKQSSKDVHVKKHHPDNLVSEELNKC
jgi:hypothetical protein